MLSARVARTSKYSASTLVVPSVAVLYSVHNDSNCAARAVCPASSSRKNAVCVGPKWRRNRRRGRYHFGGDLKRPPNKAFGSPVCHGNQSPRFAHPNQLGGDSIRSRGEHGAEHGQHDVERVIGVGELFCVAFIKLDFQTFGGSPLACLQEQIWRDVNARYRRAGA